MLKLYLTFLKLLLTRHQGLLKNDKGLRKYGALVERALASWEVSPQEWADYIAFLARLLKVIVCLRR